MVVDLGGIADHIEKLKQVTTGTQKLVGLLGEQLQALSGTIPVLRALQIVRVCFHPIDLRTVDLSCIVDKRAKGAVARMS